MNHGSPRAHDLIAARQEARRHVVRHQREVANGKSPVCSAAARGVRSACTAAARMVATNRVNRRFAPEAVRENA